MLIPQLQTPVSTTRTNIDLHQLATNFRESRLDKVKLECKFIKDLGPDPTKRIRQGDTKHQQNYLQLPQECNPPTQALAMPGGCM